MAAVSALVSEWRVGQTTLFIEETDVPDLVQQLRASATQARALDRSELLHQAAGEIARLRGEVALWKAAATLTTHEADTLGQAVTLAAGSRLGDRLRWLLERLTDCKDSSHTP